MQNTHTYTQYTQCTILDIRCIKCIDNCMYTFYIMYTYMHTIIYEGATANPVSSMPESGTMADIQVSEANNAAVPCFLLVWDACPQFVQFVVQRLNVSQQNGWERTLKGTASQSDEDTSSLPSFSATFPSSRSCGPDKGLCVCKQSAGINELIVRFLMCDGGADF